MSKDNGVPTNFLVTVWQPGPALSTEFSRIFPASEWDRGFMTGRSVCLRPGLPRSNWLGSARASKKISKDKLEQRVWFPGRAEALAQEPGPAARREAYRRVIAWYLHECKERGWPVSVASARHLMERVERERQPAAERLAAWRNEFELVYPAGRQARHQSRGPSGE